MKSYLLLAVICMSVSGCSAAGYARNRARDAADVFSLTATNGVGVVAQASFVNTGVGFVGDVAGLSDGDFFHGDGIYTSNGGRACALLIGSYEPRGPI